MTSFGYRSNPRYAIKECSSCKTLYTRDYVCSIGTIKDKILVPKHPKNYARCTRCGYLVDGPNCQGCALLRQKLEENLVTHFPDFQISFEPSNASTNVVNAPREPYVIKQDNGSFVDKISFDLNRAPDSPNQFHCFHCKDVLRDGEACKRCTYAKYGSGLGKGLCYICGHNQNSLNDSLSIYETSSQSPPNINHCCYECGDLLDGIFFKRCTCKSCGKDAHIGYNCPSKVSVISIPEPCNNQTIDELPQALPIFHPTFRSEAERPFTLDSTCKTHMKNTINLKFFFYKYELMTRTRDEVSDQHSYCFNVEDDPKTFDEAMKSQDVAFWKKAINDEIDSIMGNNTWVLAELPPGCKPLGCKCYFKRKLKVDGTIKKFKARLVIQGFKQKSGIDYFDTYAPVARTSTIRLLIAMTSIHNPIIHQMDVKTTFLNGELDDETPKQWHLKFDEVVLSNGYYLTKITNVYVTNLIKLVDLKKEFLSSRFSMKDMGEADVILGIRIKHESNRVAISESHFIENAVSQLKYSRVIGCLMYAMTCTRPDIAFVVGKLRRYTSNPGTQHWQAIQRVLKYLKKIMDNRLTYTVYPSVLEGYTDASWISNTEDNSSTCGWVFLLSFGAISWASKKQTCIIGSTMESEFVVLAVAGKEAEWLKNLLLEILLWSKPIAPIFIHCDSAATLAKAYSQMYSGNSRHLGVRHNMIREMITNGVISIEFVRSQQNLADHLTKGVVRDLVIKSAEGMRLKSN
nr:zinc finger, CCHC-type [Tanacetum cinerariifolium]